MSRQQSVRHRAGSDWAGFRQEAENLQERTVTGMDGGSCYHAETTEEVRKRIPALQVFCVRR
ncbi:hypothetical protein DXA13_13870 [Clostridium sp. AM58-1XD]|nr:hypothetical protein DXA13_13870 [Clostridium sp. AM58-1XD]